MKKILSILLISIMCLSLFGCKNEEFKKEDISLINKQLQKSNDLRDYNTKYAYLITETFWKESKNINSDDFENITEGYNELENKTKEIDINLLNNYINYCKENSKSPLIAITILKNYYNILAEMETYKDIIDTMNKDDFNIDDLIKIRKLIENFSNN